MKIGTNVSSMQAQEYLRKSGQGLETAMERLSSGKRVNSAKDDAAGLAISERMSSKIRGMEVGIRNSNDGVSLVQTAESALGSVSSILQRMRELSVQSANGTNTATDRASLNTEYAQLKEEIDHIASKTTFNGVQLLDGTVPTVDIQLSDEANDTMTIILQDATSATLLLTSDISTVAGANGAMGELDGAIDSISNARATFGANLNRLNFNIDNIQSMKNNLSQANSRIVDADMAAESSAMTKYKILQQSGTAMLTQANQNPQLVTQLLQ